MSMDATHNRPHYQDQYIVSLTCDFAVCSLPLPPLQTGDIPGSCERTLLQHSHFPYAPQNFLFTQDMTIEKRK